MCVCGMVLGVGGIMAEKVGGGMQFFDCVV